MCVFQCTCGMVVSTRGQQTRCIRCGTILGPCERVDLKVEQSRGECEAKRRRGAGQRGMRRRRTWRQAPRGVGGVCIRRHSRGRANVVGTDRGRVSDPTYFNQYRIKAKCAQGTWKWSCPTKNQSVIVNQEERSRSSDLQLRPTLRPPCIASPKSVGSRAYRCELHGNRWESPANMCIARSKKATTCC